MTSRTLLLLFFSTVILLNGCSTDEKKAETEQTTISSQAEQTGKQAAAGIKAPLDKTEAVAELENARNQQLKDQAESQ